MEVRNIHIDAGWYVSYMTEKQGASLIECQSRKIQQLERIVEELGVADVEKVSVTIGSFTWEG